jgi:hypothetical protein
MTNEEAKFMLAGYRPNGADANDPVMTEALAQAQRDPALRVWFEREQAFDRIIADKLTATAPPAGLRESILAGKKLSTSTSGSPQPRWWSRPWTIGLAAAAAVVVAFTLSWSEPTTRLAPLPGMQAVLSVALADFEGAHGMGPKADKLGQFGAWLGHSETRLGSAVMPVDLDELRALGCRTINVAGHEIFEICFQRGSDWYHVFIAPRDAFDADRLDDDLMFHQKGEFVAAAWADQSFVYLVSGTSDLATLRGLL